MKKNSSALKLRSARRHHAHCLRAATAAVIESLENRMLLSADPSCYLIPADISNADRSRTNWEITVVYQDSTGIQLSSIDNMDVQVVGPAFATPQAATLVKVTDDLNNLATGDAPLLKAVYSINAPNNGTWDDSKYNGSYIVSINPNQVSNIASPALFVASGNIGDFDVNLTAAADPFPTAKVTATDITVDQAAPYKFKITYTGKKPIDISDLTDTDIWVDGPNGFHQAASIDLLADGSKNITDGTKVITNDALTCTVTYVLQPPNGKWDVTCNGTYSIILQPNTVRDNNLPPLYIAGGQLAQFQVNIITYPDATLQPIAPITSPSPTLNIQVLYSHPMGIDPQSISDNGNSTILVSGPRFPSGTFASFTSMELQSDGLSYLATYQLSLPGRDWTYYDNGNYTISIVAQKINDLQTPPLSVKAAQLGTLSIQVPMASLSGEVLTLNGTEYDDVINLNVGTGGSLTITMTSYLPSGIMKATQNVDLTTFVGVQVNALGGNDKVTIGDKVIGATVDGGAGNDTLVGGTDDDSLLGGADNDLLDGGAGNDSLDGGDGDDTILAGTAADGNDTLAGGAGIDTLDYSKRTAALTLVIDGITLSGDRKVGEWDTINPDFEIVQAGTGNDTLSASNGEVTLYGNGGNDSLVGGAEDQVLDGGNGNDTLVAGDGVTTLLGGEGNDLLIGGTSGDSLSGGDDDDTLQSGSGNDTLDGGAGIDTADYSNRPADQNLLIVLDGQTPSGWVGGGESDIILANVENATGGAGNDTLSGNAADNILNGGAGNDLFNAGSAPAGADTYIGGTGINTADFSRRNGNLTINLNGQTNSSGGGGLFGGGTGTSTTSGETGEKITLQNIQQVYGGSGDDTITGSDASETIYGNGGADLITGKGGNDRLDGGSGDDTIDGGTGNDTVYGGDGENIITGADGNDLLNGGNNNDSIDGGIGNDTIYGLAGDDTITGGTGNDSISGDDGNDQISDIAGDDTIRGGAGNDTIDGGAGNDELRGGFGDDLILGAIGNDLLYGGEGNDTLDGGIGNDTLNGCEGDDYLIGGPGGTNDADIFAGGADFDIADYSTRLDALNLSLDGFANDGNQQVNNNRGEGDNILSDVEGIIGGSNNDTIIGNSGDNSLDGGAGNDYIEGKAGNDTLYGSDGDDRLLAGIGNDRIYGDRGNDTLIGGVGDDTIDGGLGNDFLFGREGNDILWGNEGNDLLTGDDGADIFIVNDGLSPDYNGDGNYVGGGIPTWNGDTIDGGNNSSDGRYNTFTYNGSTFSTLSDLAFVDPSANINLGRQYECISSVESVRLIRPAIDVFFPPRPS